MRIKWRLIEKPIAACLVLLLAAPVARAEPLPGQEAAASQETEATPPAATQQATTAPDSAPVTTAQSPIVEAPTSSSSTPLPGAEVAQNETDSSQNAPASASQPNSFAAQRGSTTEWCCATGWHSRGPGSERHRSCRITSQWGGDCARKAAACTHIPDQYRRGCSSLRRRRNRGGADSRDAQPAALMDPLELLQESNGDRRCAQTKKISDPNS